MKRVCSIIALAIGIASPALGDTAAGRWSFETAPVNENCVLTGEMSIQPTSTPGQFSCHFVSVQACTTIPPIEIEVLQTCTATQTGVQVNIESAVENIVRAEPEEFFPQIELTYAPDHFFVSLNTTGDEMTGMFHSLSNAFVRFTRLEDLTS